MNGHRLPVVAIPIRVIMVLLLTARTLASLYTGGPLAEDRPPVQDGTEHFAFSISDRLCQSFFSAYNKETIQLSITRSRVTLEHLLFVLVFVQGTQPHFARDKTYPRSFPAKMELKK